MIKLREMSEAEFKRIAEFSFDNFVSEMAKSSAKISDEVRKKMGSAPDRKSEDDLWRIIELDEKEIGFIWLKLDPENSSAFGYDIWLDEAFRDRGLGRQVMKQGRELLQSLGIKRIQICVFEENARARALYASLGFKSISIDPARRQHRLELSLEQR